MMKLSANRGFTLIELMVTIAIVGIVSMIAVPNMIGWRAERKMRGAVNNLQGDMQLARFRAIRDAENVAVVFNPGANSYTVFVDSNLSWTLDAGEDELRNVTLPVGVTLNTNFPPSGSNRTRFNSKGMPSVIGTVKLINTADAKLDLVVNRVGRLQVKKG